MVNLKKRFYQLETRRLKLLDLLLSDCPLIHGSYTELLVKCGRAGCHCENNPAHLVARLNIRNHTRAQNKVVRVDDRKEVQKLVKKYKQHKDSLQKLIKIHQEQKEIIKKLMERKNVGYK